MESEEFEYYIEINGDLQENRDEENETSLVKSAKVKAKKEQFDKIAVFLSENNEALMDKDVYNKLWDSLTLNLNAMGPPSFSSVEWKRKWSDHKYNKKRKRSSGSMENPLCQDHISVTQKPFEVDSENIRLLRVLVDKQNVQIAHQETIIEKLDKVICLFQGMSKKL